MTVIHFDFSRAAKKEDDMKINITLDSLSTEPQVIISESAVDGCIMITMGNLYANVNIDHLQKAISKVIAE